MDNAAQPAPEQGQSGSASQLVVDINDKLTELSGIIAKSSAVTPEDKSALGQILGSYQKFVEGLGAPAGQAPQAAPEPQMKGAPMPMHAAPGGM